MAEVGSGSEEGSVSSVTADKAQTRPHVPDHTLLRSIGQGSYGEVWLARCTLGHFRAVKLVHRHGFDSDRPFEREFSGIRRFEPLSRSHEGFVDILQLGRSDGYFYRVMELADDAAEPPRSEEGGAQMEHGGDSAVGTRHSPASSLQPPASVPLDPGRYVPKTLARQLRRRQRLPLDECLPLALLQSGESLQRLRRVERRLALATRAAVAVTVLAVVAVGGYMIQQAQSRKFQKLAEANQRLAENRHDDLVRMNLDNGQRLVEEGDKLGALPWYANALALVRGDPAKEAEHRLRLAAILQQSPRLLHLWHHEAAVNYAEFSPDGRWLVTASRDQTARIWDVLTGQPVSPPLVHTSEVARAIISPDGRQVVTVSKGTQLWEAQTGKLLRADPYPVRSAPGKPPMLFHRDHCGPPRPPPSSARPTS